VKEEEFGGADDDDDDDDDKEESPSLVEALKDAGGDEKAVNKIVEAAAAEEAVVSAGDVLDVAGKDGIDSMQGGHRREGQGSGGDYGAAYKELFEQLCSRMVNRILKYFYRLYAVTRDEKKFKQKLVGILQWNQDEINAKAAEFLKQYKDIIRIFRFAYAANVLVMSVVIQRDEGSNDIEVDCPKFSEFCHRCYVETARKIFYHVGILDPSLPASEKLAVANTLYTSVCNAVSDSLRMMVPMHKLAPVKAEDEEQYDFINGKSGIEGLDIDDQDMKEIVDEEETELKAAELDGPDSESDEEEDSEQEEDIEEEDSDEEDREEEDSEEEDSEEEESGSDLSSEDDEGFSDSEEDESDEELPPPPSKSKGGNKDKKKKKRVRFSKNHMRGDDEAENDQDNDNELSFF
jgi:hypothetical protein